MARWEHSASSFGLATATPRRARLALELFALRKAASGLYGAGVGDDGRFYAVRRANWECRKCAGLRYASEGGALLIRSRGRLGRLFGVGRIARPEPWLPYVLASPMDAIAAGFAGLSESRRSL